MKTRLSFYICLAAFLVSCSSETGNQTIIDIGRSDADGILDYYFGVYAGSSPFELGVISKKGDTYLLANNYLELAPELEAFSAYTEDGILDWEDIKSAVSDSYYNTSDAPANVSALKADESALFTVDLHGVMSDAKRTIKLRKSNLEKALLQFEENNSEILYPIGSTFVADHQLDGQTKETTVMRKLDSGYWAYWVYDDQGNLALKTNSSPRKLKAPTQCIGCHMGQKQFEPSSSFPRLLEDKERRKRQIYTSSQLRNLSPRLDEHQKRSDSVLGPYGAIYIAQLRSSSESLSEKEKELLDSFSSN